MSLVGSPGGPPNIVLIMTDDQGYGDLGVTGNPVLETPRIDALAAQSASVARFYVSPVCTPTRASLMTGRYHLRTRAIDTWRGRAMMEPREATIAELLRPAGYATGIFGKWHLGDCYPMRPIDQGFDRAVVHRGGGLAQPSEPLENERRYTDPILFDNGTAVHTRGYCTDVYFDYALEFIESAHAAGRPFFVYVAPNAPHDPFHDVPPDLYAKYRALDLDPVLPPESDEHDRIARTFAMIENIDANVGRLLDALDRLAIERDTIVVYLHDNGPALPRYNAGLRGRKGGVYEGGIRSPLFVRWPARIDAGTVVAGIGAHIDVAPTLLAAAGVVPPPGVAFDGRSLLPELMKRPGRRPSRAIVVQAHRGDRPQRLHHVAVIEERWKLLRASGFGRAAAPDHVPLQLFDLPADPGERRDVAGAHPETVRRLTRVYDDWFEDVSSTRRDNYDPPRIIIGTAHERTTVLTGQDRRAPAAAGAGGAWLVTIAERGDYALQVLLDRPVPDGRAEVTCGEQAWSATWSAPSARIDVRLDDVAPGDAALRVEVVSAGATTQPYHVILRRDPAAP
jgi:arylsulfatase/arylsulfatase A